jgi:hypothetical protein
MDDFVTGWQAASKATGLSVPQLRRLADAGKLQASTDGEGRRVFRRADLDATREAALAAEQPPSSGPRAGCADGGTEEPPSTAAASADAAAPPAHGAEDARPPADLDLDRDVMVAVFGDLSKERSLVQIAMDRKMLASELLRLHAEYRRLCGVDVNAPAVPAAVAALREGVNKYAERTNAAIAALQHEVEDLKRELAKRPVLRVEEWTCECGEQLEVKARCPMCGRTQYLPQEHVLKGGDDDEEE